MVHFADTNTYLVISTKSHSVTALNRLSATITIDYGKEGIFSGDIVMYGTKKKCDYYCDKFVKNQEICFTDDEVEVNPSKKLKSNGNFLIM